MPFKDTKVLFSTKIKDKSILFMFDSEENFQKLYESLLSEKVSMKVNFKKMVVEVFED